jgi:hypothetical protein
MKTFTPPVYYEYFRTIRVDKTGRGDVTRIEDALAIASAYPRDSVNRVRIELVNDRFFIPNAIEVPSYTTIQGIVTNPYSYKWGTQIYRSVTPDLGNATHFIKLNEGCVLENLWIACFTPTTFNNDFTLIQMEGECTIKYSYLYMTDYSGPNTAYVCNIENTTIGCNFYDVRFQGHGSSTINVRHNTDEGADGFYMCWFAGDPYGHAELLHQGDQGSTFWNCRMYSNYPLGQRATNYVLKTNTDTTVRLYSTRIDLNERDIYSTTTINEIHPTPQQLETSERASSLTVYDDYTIDAYEDGTIRVDTTVDPYTVILPNVNDCIIGQSFIVKKVGNNDVTVEGGGEGVPIDGNFSVSITVLNDALKFQLNDQGSWDLI